VDFLVGEVEDLVEHLLLRGQDLTGVFGLGHDHPDVLLRVGDDAGRRGLDPEQSCEHV